MGLPTQENERTTQREKDVNMKTKQELRTSKTMNTKPPFT